MRGEVKGEEVKCRGRREDLLIRSVGLKKISDARNCINITEADAVRDRNCRMGRQEGCNW